VQSPARAMRLFDGLYRLEEAARSNCLPTGRQACYNSRALRRLLEVQVRSYCDRATLTDLMEVFEAVDRELLRMTYAKARAGLSGRVKDLASRAYRDLEGFLSVLEDFLLPISRDYAGPVECNTVIASDV
jgi:hypothetical protein